MCILSGYHMKFQDSRGPFFFWDILGYLHEGGWVGDEVKRIKSSHDALRLLALVLLTAFEVQQRRLWFLYPTKKSMAYLEQPQAKKETWLENNSTTKLHVFGAPL